MTAGPDPGPAGDLREAVERAVAGGRLSETAASQLRKWSSHPAYATERESIGALLARGDLEEIQDAFGAVIPFGTGGRRGAMGPGPNRINERTIAESAEGLSRYVRRNRLAGAPGPPADRGSSSPARSSGAARHFEAGAGNGEGGPRRDAADGRGRIVVAYDTRHNSRRFAEVAASVIAGNGIEALLFEGPRSTPQLSFAVRHLAADAGIVISASHNPPGDNGFKAYWSDGGQVVPPHDRAIIDEVLGAEEIAPLELGEAARGGLFREIGREVDRAYVSYVAGLALGSERSIRLVYTPLHGTGTTSVAPALAAAGFADVHRVATQWEPDPEFRGVPGRSPNPENPPALEAAVRTAEAAGADLVIGSDPDADRLGAVVKHGGNWEFLTGNRIGVLLFHHIVQSLEDGGRIPRGARLLKTCVTSDLLDRIAETHGVAVVGDFLVGFKYVAEELNRMGETTSFVFGIEESHGYLRGPSVRDKDAAQAAVLLAEYAAELKSKGRTLIDALDAVWSENGYHAELTRSIALGGTGGGALGKRIMEALRAKPPREIAGEKVVAVADRRSGLVTDPESGRETGRTRGIPGDLLVFHLRPGGGERISIRPSGTEPKIKMYIQILGSRDPDLTRVRAETDARAERLAADFEKIARRA